MEKTLVIVKPDGVQRNLIGEIISRLEKSGLKMVAAKMLQPDEKLIEKHYTIDPDWFRLCGEKNINSYKKKGLTPPSEDPIEVGKMVLQKLKQYLTFCPVVSMVWEGSSAVELVRKITGGTEPLGAAPMGTIRGDYCLESYLLADSAERAVRNLVHASGSVAEAEKEIALWFDNKEIMDYKLTRDTIIYDKEWNIA